MSVSRGLLSALTLLRVFKGIPLVHALHRLSLGTWPEQTPVAVSRDLAGVMTRKGMFGLLAGTKREAVKYPRGVGADTSSDRCVTRTSDCRTRLRMKLKIRLDYFLFWDAPCGVAAEAVLVPGQVWCLVWKLWS